MSARKWKKTKDKYNHGSGHVLIHNWTLSGSTGRSRRSSAFGRIRLDHYWCALTRTCGSKYKEIVSVQRKKKRGLRKQISGRRRWHSEKPVVAIMVKFYERPTITMQINVI